jgi:hypothetical protein
MNAEGKRANAPASSPTGGIFDLGFLIFEGAGVAGVRSFEHVPVVT